MTSKRVRSKKATKKASRSPGGGTTRKKAKSASAASSEGSARPDDMPEDVLEFITAIDDYKRRNERPFPTWSEILEVLKGLGYHK